MESFLPRSAKIILIAVIAIVFLLGRLARVYPGVRWLQVFWLNRNLTEEQKLRMRRSADRHAGVELILLGVVMPIVYFGLTVMFFSELETGITLLVSAGSVLCIGLGMAALRK